MDQETSKALRILVIDDNPWLCEGIQVWLTREPGVGSVACQTDWKRAAIEAKGRQPDVVLLDVDLAGKSGFDLIASLRAASPASKILILSGMVDRQQVERALDLGAAGYLVKDQEVRVLADLIRRAGQGAVVLCPAAEAALAGR